MFWRDSQSTYQAWCMKTHWLKAAELQSTDDLAIHRMLEQHQMQAHKERERRTSGSGETLTNKATPSCVNTHSAGHSPPTQTLLWRTNGVDSCAASAPNYTNVSDKRWTTTTTTTAKNLAAHCSCVSKWIFVLLCFVFTLWGNLSVLVQAKHTVCYQSKQMILSFINTRDSKPWYSWFREVNRLPQCCTSWCFLS